MALKRPQQRLFYSIIIGCESRRRRRLHSIRMYRFFSLNVAVSGLQSLPLA